VQGHSPPWGGQGDLHQFQTQATAGVTAEDTASAVFELNVEARL
jgi:hypothetical protein